MLKSSLEKWLVLRIGTAFSFSTATDSHCRRVFVISKTSTLHYSVPMPPTLIFSSNSPIIPNTSIPTGTKYWYFPLMTVMFAKITRLRFIYVLNSSISSKCVSGSTPPT